MLVRAFWALNASLHFQPIKVPCGFYQQIYHTLPPPSTPPCPPRPAAADWMLGDVPDMPAFTPLTPVDTSLPTYDEADLSVCGRERASSAVRQKKQSAPAALASFGLLASSTPHLPDRQPLLASISTTRRVRCRLRKCWLRTRRTPGRVPSRGRMVRSSAAGGVDNVQCSSAPLRQA